MWGSQPPPSIPQSQNFRFDDEPELLHLVVNPSTTTNYQFGVQCVMMTWTLRQCFRVDPLAAFTVQASKSTVLAQLRSEVLSPVQVRLAERWLVRRRLLSQPASYLDEKSERAPNYPNPGGKLQDIRHPHLLPKWVRPYV